MQNEPTTNAMRTACDSVESLKTLLIDVVKNRVDNDVHHHPSAETKTTASKNCQRYSCDYVVNCTILPSDRTQWSSGAIQQHGPCCIDQSHKSDCFSTTKPPTVESKVSSFQVANSNSKSCLSRPNSVSSAGFVMAEGSLSQSSKHKSTTKTSYTSATVRNTSISNMERIGVKMMNKGSKVANGNDIEKVDSSDESNSPCVCPSVRKAGINSVSEGKSRETSSKCPNPVINEKTESSNIAKMSCEVQQPTIIAENASKKNLVPSDVLSLVSSSSTSSGDAISLSSGSGSSRSTTYYQLVDDDPLPPSTASSSTICLSSLSSSTTTGTSSLFGRSATNYEEFFAKLGLPGYESLKAKKDVKMESGDTVGHSIFTKEAQAENEINFSHVIGGGIVESDFDKHSLSTIFSTEEKSAVAVGGNDNNLSNSTMTLHSAKDSAAAHDYSVEKLMEAVVNNTENDDDVKQKSPIIDDDNDQRNTIFNVNDEKTAVPATVGYKRQRRSDSSRTTTISAKNSRGDSTVATKKREQSAASRKQALKIPIRNGRPPLYQGRRGQRVPGIIPLAQPKSKPLARRPSLISGRRDSGRPAAAASVVRKCSSVSSVLNVAAGDSGRTTLKSSACSVVVVSNTSFRSRDRKFASREILRATVSEPHLIAGRDDESQNSDSKIGSVAKNRMIVVKMNTAAKLRANAIKKKYSLL